VNAFVLVFFVLSYLYICTLAFVLLTLRYIYIYACPGGLKLKLSSTLAPPASLSMSFSSLARVVYLLFPSTLVPLFLRDLKGSHLKILAHVLIYMSISHIKVSSQDRRSQATQAKESIHHAKSALNSSKSRCVSLVLDVHIYVSVRRQ